ncbi:oligosaccharide flippase family protein [Paraburkholderia sp. B3]|uniref:oligosaccharide flippase family protein n=1 Tax=Paraburkholderia sp. B3 TaxID=3134791 RepID=UPI00398247AB
MFLMVMSLAGNYIASFATFPYLTRVLGPEHFGLLAYAMSIAAYGALLSEWGFSLSGPRAVVACRSNREATNHLIWSVIGGKALICAICTAFLLGYIALGTGTRDSQIVLLVSWSGVAANVCTVYWLFQGLEKFNLISALVFSNRLVTVPLTFFLVKKPDDICIAAAIQATGPIVAAFISLLIAYKEGYIGRPVLKISSIMKQLRDGTDMFVATASVTLFGSANSVILMHFSGAYAAGIYAGADKIRVVANLVPAQISAVVYPRIERLLRSDRRVAAKLIVYGVSATAIISAATVSVIAINSDLIVRIVLGAAFQGAGNVLFVLCFSAIFGNLAYFIGLQILVPSGASRKRSVSIFVAGLINITLSLAMVPKLGAKGAAEAFVISEAIIFMIYVALIFWNERSRRILSLFSFK